MKILKYILTLVVLGFVSCRDFHINFSGDTVLSEVGSSSLMLSQLDGVVPKEYKGEDSVIFVQKYIDKWIRQQVKLREAERIFVTSQEDIESKVEEYRQSLLIKRLDEHYVRMSRDTVYTDAQISQYYNNNANNFRLACDIVKGEYMRIPQDEKLSKKLVELMASPLESKRKDLLSLCEKNGYPFVSLASSWVDASAILDNLPLTRSDDTSKVLARTGVNHVSDAEYDYYYHILGYKRVGDIAPLEWVSSTIRQILINERQQALIRSSEEKLYREAESEELIKRQYLNNETEK